MESGEMQGGGGLKFGFSAENSEEVMAILLNCLTQIIQCIEFEHSQKPSTTPEWQSRQA